MNIYKRYLNFGFGLLFAASTLVSCTDDDTEFVSNADSKPTLTVEQAAYTVREGHTVDITMTLSQAIAAPVIVKFDVIDADTNQPINSTDSPYYDDFLFGSEVDIAPGFGYNGYTVTIPAGVTSYTFSLEAFLDEEFEQAENVKLRFYPEGNMGARIVEGSNFIDVTLVQNASDVVEFTFGWDQNFELFGTQYSLYEIEYDLDFYIVAEDGTIIENFDAATADAPEHMSLDIAALPEGDYQIVANLYDNGGLAGNGIPPFDIPVTVSYSRIGSETLNTEGSFTQTSNFINSEDASDPDFATAYVVSNFSLATDASGQQIITFYNDDNGVIVSGRTAANLQALAGKKALKVKAPARRLN